MIDLTGHGHPDQPFFAGQRGQIFEVFYPGITNRCGPSVQEGLGDFQVAAGTLGDRGDLDPHFFRPFYNGSGIF